MRPPRDFSVVLPPGWTRLVMDDDLGVQVVRLVDSQVGSLPGERREGARRAVTKVLEETLDQARRAGGTDVLVSVATAGGYAAPASCLVTYQDREGAPLEALVDHFAMDGDATELAELGVGPAVRRVRRQPLPVSSAGMQAVADAAGVDLATAASARTAVLTEVTWVVPVPGSDGLLVLSFGTPVDELGEAMTVLFDAIAGTLRWVG